MGGWRGAAGDTLAGLTMGAAFAGDASGITIRTGCNGASSAGSPSGAIYNPAAGLMNSANASGVIKSWVGAFSLSIADSDRVNYKSNVPITLAFKPTVSVPIGGIITVSAPGFFYGGVTIPPVAAGASSVAGLSVASFVTTDSSFQLIVGGQETGTSAFTITVQGFKLNGPTGGSYTANVATTADVCPVLFSPAPYHPPLLMFP
jgi:hypothetical protein